MVPAPCRYATEMFIMKWHSAIVWLPSVPVYRLAAQLSAVPPHFVLLPREAVTSGECFVLGTDMSVALAAFTHLQICHWEENVFCL